MGEIRLPGHRADGSEFRGGEPGDVIRVGMGVRRPVEGFRVRRFGNLRRPSEVVKSLMAPSCLGTVATARLRRAFA